jgi:LysR family cys regulon transcriptional activator
LRQRDAKRLFAPSTLGIVVRRNSYLRGYMIDFMRLFAPALKKSDVDKAVAGHRVAYLHGNLPSL